MKDPTEHLRDDEDDESYFEIALINKNNSALVVDCKVRMGEVKFDNVFVVDKGGDEFLKSGIWVDKVHKKLGNKFYGKTHGPKFAYLSETL